jgi:hypothetical protein
LVEILQEGEDCKENTERREGEREERGVGEKEKDEKRLQQSPEILSMDTGPFHSNGIHPFQLNNVLYQIEMRISVLIAESMK